MSKYYTYEKQNFTCTKCKWSGLGEQTELGDMINWDSMEILCPKCYDLLTVIMFPTYEEIMEYGTDEEKVSAQERQDFLARVCASELKSIDQLPEIESEEIIITLREEGKETDGKDGYIVLFFDEKEIWREIRTYEYYERFIEIGHILKEKYGNRLVDFETEYTLYLGGDRYNAFEKVREFRKSLSGKSDMSDAEFDLATQSGQFDPKEATYWKALDFAKERHAGQTRDEGTTPYFSHIEGTIDILRQCGKISDRLFTIAALHDVLEDTKTTKKEIYNLLKISSRNVDNGEIRDIIAEVDLLTKKGDSFKEYIDRIFDDNSIKREEDRYNHAKIVKLADRLHNLATLHLCGKPEKIQCYIRETEEFIMPWRDKHKDCEVLFERIEKRLEELKSMYGDET